MGLLPKIQNIQGRNHLFANRTCILIEFKNITLKKSPLLVLRLEYIRNIGQLHACWENGSLLSFWNMRLEVATATND